MQARSFETEQLPSMAELLARVAEFEPAAVSVPAADVIREAREERDEQLTARPDCH